MSGFADFLRAPLLPGPAGSSSRPLKVTEQADIVFAMLSSPPAPQAAVEASINPAMRDPASNTVGAWFRVAYWLGVAWRIQANAAASTSILAYLRQSAPGGRLWAIGTAAAFAFVTGLVAAGMGASRYIGVGFGYDLGDALARMALGGPTGTRSDDRARIREVYDWGLRVSDRFNVVLPMRELQAIASKPLPKDRNLPWYLTVGGALAVAGVGLYLVKPYVEVAASVAERLPRAPRTNPRLRTNPRRVTRRKRRGLRSR